MVVFQLVKDPWAWCGLCCTVLASPSTFNLEQRLLLVGWPAICAWALRGHGKSWSANLLQALAAIGTASFVVKLWSAQGFASALLPCASLISLLTLTKPQSEVPWWSLVIIGIVAASGDRDLQHAAGLALGRLDGGPLIWSFICVVISTLALVGWSKLWVRGDHGPIQDFLAPLLSPASVLPFAVVNAFREEIQFRMLLLGGILAGDALASPFLTAFSLLLHSTLFALLHYLGGFPRGVSGFLLVLIWGLFLDILRLWSGGMALVLLLHVQADVTIFLLVLVEARRRRAS
mmetsp:Transcript_54015/g.101316  ORF Transcript_54015/g.101316 Transcript_54015/m.101316 type:complete len:290 (+) Transcript_54015:24-893(+)